MIPNAKRNLHECEYHLNKMIESQNIEELEINFAAFVNSARNVTFVLQKEFNENKNFETWYKQKQEEMGNDELCTFFNELRNRIVKEGINQVRCNTVINKFNSSTDVIDRPSGADLIIKSKGIYFLINSGTPQEDLIPAKTRVKIITTVFVENAPKNHLGQAIQNNNIIEISRIYYSYLKNLVEEWTGIWQQIHPSAKTKTRQKSA